ncbi:DsbA family protein [Aurantimonas marina]|uniref:DsbA family protein n=1 Tax=Aurantimonas marina TaxID=2780508 RepID=UPI0019D258AB|nr:DsbA family protein [Aurantimonas marina]
MSDNPSSFPQTPHLIYFADPMCSWCWGFAPVIEAIAELYPDLAIRLVLGGLRPFTDKRMDASAKADIRNHWEHVRDASGQPFDFSFFERDDFVYDTEPAARAVVAGRQLGPEKAIALEHRIARAFYAENRDVTDSETLADLAAELGFDRTAFQAAFAREDTRQETLGDFALSQHAGVTGFPTLIAGPQADGNYALVTAGFQPSEPVLARVGLWLEQQRAVA